MRMAYLVFREPDLGFVETTLLPALPSNGIGHWISSRQLDAPGRPSRAEVAMAQSHVIVIVVSRASVTAPGFASEVEQALASDRPALVAQADDLSQGELERFVPRLTAAPTIPHGSPNASHELVALLPALESSPDPQEFVSVAVPIAWNEKVFSAELNAAVTRHDRNQAERLVEAFAQHAAGRTAPYPAEHANGDLAILRQERQFKLMRTVGEALLATGTRDEKVRRQLSQALIEEREYSPALELLDSIIADQPPKHPEVIEAKGLKGRAFKQQYVDAPHAPTAPALLQSAIEAYESVYRDDHTQLWHGVNAASCRLRGHRDGLQDMDPDRAEEIARGVLVEVEALQRATKLHAWDCASRIEAFLALGDFGRATESLDPYLTHPGMHAFEVSSTCRQFDEVLQLDEDPRGEPIMRRLWDAVERFRAGGMVPRSSRDAARSSKPALRSLLIRVTDPEWKPAAVQDLELQSRLGTIISARGSDASVRELLRDSAVISVEESLPTKATNECKVSLPFIGVPPYPGPGGSVAEGGDAALIAVIDAGIDVLHETFLDAHGRSRIVAIWDQTDATGPCPAGFAFGTYHDAAAIAGYVKTRQVPYGLERDTGGHGTHVASIAAGRTVGQFAGGVAPEARIVVVISAAEQSIGYSASHVQALAFIESIASDTDLPVVVNVSQGMNAGAHDGKSALEVAFDEFSKGGRRPGRIIVKSAGNEREKDGHAKLTVTQGGKVTAKWARHPGADPQDRIEFWWSSADELEFQLSDPAGTSGPWIGSAKAQETSASIFGCPLLMQFTKRHVDNGDSKLEIQIGDENTAAALGTWRLAIRAGKVPNGGEIHAWIERSLSDRPTSFQPGDQEMTISIPGTAQNVITVGAVASTMPLELGDFSSFGPTRDGRRKPDVVAPGVAVHAALAGTYSDAVPLDGSSMAAPHVAGAIALLLSRAKKSGQVVPTSTQIASALCQKTQNYTGNWDRGFGYGLVDVAALLAAF